MTRRARIERARALRADSTDCERKLWSILRDRKLSGVKFRRQHPIDRFFADFACVEAHLVVELDGGQHAERAAQDDARTEIMSRQGWRVIRFWNAEVIEKPDGVADTIIRALSDTGSPPHPDAPAGASRPLPPAGEGGTRGEAVGG